MWRGLENQSEGECEFFFFLQNRLDPSAVVGVGQWRVKTGGFLPGVCPRNEALAPSNDWMRLRRDSAI